ncbi:hypothetical protein [Allocoleopsis franciscana]|uniref:hypothetical protein n=1 Tax=Allocoleopsis franciscana TaxID=2886352 RepID=UPI0012DF4A86|nr:hypothetical protein [Allocoleopsis franciscana]
MVSCQYQWVCDRIQVPLVQNYIEQVIKEKSERSLMNNNALMLIVGSYKELSRLIASPDLS